MELEKTVELPGLIAVHVVRPAVKPWLKISSRGWLPRGLCIRAEGRRAVPCRGAQLASQVPGSISDRETSSKKTRLRVGEKTRKQSCKTRSWPPALMQIN